MDAKGAVQPAWQAKRDEFISHAAGYFDASSTDALKFLKDVEGEDSDLKWLEVVRGIRPGVAQMGGIECGKCHY